MDRKEIFQKLTDEQKEAARNLKTPEEAAAFLKSNGIELSPDQLKSVSGGSCWDCECLLLTDSW